MTEARALVHSRAVGSLLKVRACQDYDCPSPLTLKRSQAHNATINISKLEQISPETIRERLHLVPSQIPRVVSDDRVQRSVSGPADHRQSSSIDSANGMNAPQVAKYASETSATPSRSATLYGPRAEVSMSRSPPTRQASKGWKDELPPPTPPKDKIDTSPLSWSRSAGRAQSKESFATKRAFSTSHSDLPYLSNGADEMNRTVLRPGARSTQVKVNHGSTDSARAKSMPRPLSPEEKQRMRMLARKQREEDELQAAQEESARMARIRREKEEMLHDLEREERERLERLHREKEYALAEKARRESERQREEERKAREMEEKRSKEKERRAMLARRLEEDRERNERRIQETARRKEEERKLAEVKRKAKMKEIQSRYADRIGTRPVLLEGSVTVQTSASISWKRRYFELTTHAVEFYRDSQVYIFACS